MGDGPSRPAAARRRRRDRAQHGRPRRAHVHRERGVRRRVRARQEPAPDRQPDHGRRAEPRRVEGVEPAARQLGGGPRVPARALQDRQPRLPEGARRDASSPGRTTTSAWPRSAAALPGGGPRSASSSSTSPPPARCWRRTTSSTSATGFTNVNNFPATRNSLVLDLNAGLDRINVWPIPTRSRTRRRSPSSTGRTAATRRRASCSGPGPTNALPGFAADRPVRRLRSRATPSVGEIYFTDIKDPRAATARCRSNRRSASSSSTARVTLLPFTHGGNTTGSVAHTDADCPTPTCRRRSSRSSACRSGHRPATSRPACSGNGPCHRLRRNGLPELHPRPGGGLRRGRRGPAARVQHAPPGP